jgi:pyridoxamine 5'-phosphate oxidase
MQPRLDSPTDLRQSIWHHLTRAPHDRHHAWRTPVLATTTPDREPNARTVVLRAANATRQTLTAFTDHRSAKAFELAQHPKALFVFWSARLKWQLRVRALVTVQTSGPEVDAVWQRVQQSATAGDYLTPTAPGTPLTTTDQGSEPLAAQHHLAILTAQVLEIDWLELSASGHRRARIGPDSWEWLTP